MSWLGLVRKLCLIEPKGTLWASRSLKSLRKVIHSFRSFHDVFKGAQNIHKHKCKGHIRFI